MLDITQRRGWDSLGDHGFVYMDSNGDTGVTQVPWFSRLRGSTGTFGDPRWETLDRDETFCLFAVAIPRRLLVGGEVVELDREDVAWFDDVPVLPPRRDQLRRPELAPAAATSPMALEEILGAMRAQAGLPVGDLAAMLGVSRRQFYHWIRRENEPDTAQEQRVRHTAALLSSLHERFGAGRVVRAALLTSTPHGSAFDALRAGDLTRAEAVVATVSASREQPREVAPPSQQLPYDREKVLTELEHLRDTPLR
jgi:hypothetical protein